MTCELDAHIRSMYDAKAYHGLPVTVQVVGRRMEEEKVLAVAKFLEQLLKEANDPLEVGYQFDESAVKNCRSCKKRVIE